MFLTKVKTWQRTLPALSVLLVIASTLTYPNATEPRPVAKAADKLPALLKARVEAARTEVGARNKQFLAGTGNLDALEAALQRLLRAELELSGRKDDQMATYQAHLKRMKRAEEVTRGRFDAGKIPLQDMAQASYLRLDAEIMVVRAKGK
jgi:outer membrane protein TolC